MSPFIHASSGYWWFSRGLIWVCKTNFSLFSPRFKRMWELPRPGEVCSIQPLPPILVHQCGSSGSCATGRILCWRTGWDSTMDNLCSFWWLFQRQNHFTTVYLYCIIKCVQPYKQLVRCFWIFLLAFFFPPAFLNWGSFNSLFENSVRQP